MMDLGHIWTGDQSTSYLIRTSCMLGMWEEIMMGRCDKAFADFDTPKLIRDIKRQINGDKRGYHPKSQPRVFSPINL